MKKLYLFFLFFLFTSYLNGQFFSWGKQFRSVDDKDEDIQVIRKDHNNNIYLLGKSNTYNGFDADPNNNQELIIPKIAFSTGGEGTVFIIKLDKNGNYLWSKNLSEISLDTEVDLKILNNKVFVVFNKTTKTGSNIVSKIATLNVFDENGNLLQDVPLVYEIADSFEIDENENIYISGKFSNKLKIYNGLDQGYDLNIPSLGTYFIKFDKNFRVIWSKKFEDSFGYNKIQKNNNQEIIFGTDYNFSGKYLYEIIAFDNNGNVVWKNSFEDQSFNTFTINDNNEIIISGYWANQFSPIDVNPSPSDVYNLPSNTYLSNYLLWLDQDGKMLDVKAYLNNGKNIPFMIHDISYSDKKYFINGHFSETFDYDPFLTHQNLYFGNGYIEGFSIVLDEQKKLLNVFKFGSNTYTHPNSVTRILGNLYFDKNYYYIGKFNWHTDLDPFADNYFINAIQSTVTQNFDLFLLKLSDCATNPNVSSNSPVCPNTDIKLQASGGTSYSWTGPNGFTSTEQNPIIPNATSANSGTYSCVISGAGSCDGIFTVEVKVEDKTAPFPDVPNLPDITGDCHTIVSTIPTATDNCSGKITATTTDPLQYSIPGTYTITWKYDDGNGNIFTQNQKVIITSPALPTGSSSQTFCAIDAPNISDIQISGQDIIWYDASGNVVNTTIPLVDGTTYYASQTINGCESDKIAIQVKVNATPLPTGNANQDFCTSRNAQIKDLAVIGTSLKFYDSLGNVLSNKTVLQNYTSYFVTQTLNNCESPKLEIKVTLTANSLPANDYQLTFCNDTTANSKTEDLRKYQENIITGSSAYSFEYFDQNNNPIADFANRNLIIGFNIFNVKVKSADGCWKMVQLKLQLNPKPVVNLPANAEFCRGLSVNLDVGSGFKSYVWTKEGTPTPISNAQILNVSEVGKYTVEVTNSSDCKNTSSTLVNQSILANILKVEITNNDAKVLLSANGDFVYSLDNSTWQNNPEFPNLNNGSYTVYVKTKLGCIIGEMNFTIFDIPNTFTPNSDGINDTWKITGMENYPNSEITILDRFGTAVLKKIINGTFEWNGQFNGRILPTGTYWYVLKVSDGRILQGYVLIKNRN